MIKAVAFDIGDTLISITKGVKQTLDSNVEFNFLKKSNPKITLEEYKVAIQKGMILLDEMNPQEKYKIGMPAFIILKELGLKQDWITATKLAEIFFEEQKKQTKLVQNTIEVLEKLKEQKLILGIISNAGYNKALTWLDFFKIKKYFTIITISEKTASEKSGLEPFKEFLKEVEKQGVKPSEVLMVGNDMREDTAAKNIGMKVAILKPTIAHHKKSIEPDYYLEDLLDILEVIKKEN